MRVPDDLITNDSDRQAINEGCYFDDQSWRRVVTFIEGFCCLSKGKWAGKPVKLIPWQLDLIRKLYGWKRKDGTRRFREVYVEIPKKNGKSSLVSALVLYHLIADNEQGAEVYLAAYTRKQASIIFDETAKMIRASKHLSRILVVKDSFHCKEIHYATTQSKLVALSSSAPSADGVSSSFSCIDELHRIEDPNIYNILKYAGLAREQPCLFMITTAGHDRTTVCYRQRDYADKVNTNAHVDVSFLGIIYCADEKDDIDDPKVWRKANPALGLILKEDDFREELNQAKEDTHTLNNFLRLRLNQWVAGEYKFIDMTRWHQAGKQALYHDGNPLDFYKGKACAGGLDLSSTDDTTAFSLVFNVDGIFHVLCWFWLPEANTPKREKATRQPLQQWSRKGFLTLTPGDMIDYEYVKAKIIELCEVYDVRAIYADPHNATHICTSLINEAIPIQFIHQHQRAMNAPLQFFSVALSQGKIRHGNNPVLTWQASNALAEPDSYGLIKLSKGKLREKIDGIQAMINAIACIMDESNVALPGIAST